MAVPAVSPDVSIGDRLQQLRAERGLTQEELAERAAVSVDIVKKLEQGQRMSARITTLTALALALGVPRSELLGRGPRLGGDNDRLVLGLRDTLLSPDLLVGLDPDDDGAPTPPERLWTHVERSWRNYWSGHFDDLARDLPGLIAEARIAERNLGAVASRPLAQAYSIAAGLLVHLGREDLAALSAERGLVASAAASDELQWAALNGAYCWALLAQGRHPEVERLATRVAERIEPKFSKAPPAHITVWGATVLWALAAAVEDGREDAAREYATLATVGAVRLPRDRHDYGTNFGPTQVAMQTTYVHASFGQPDKALAAAQGVRREDLRAISYGRHLLDVAQARSDMRRNDRAAATLKVAKDTAPVWFRHQPLAHTLVTNIARRQTRRTPLVRELVAALHP